MALPASGDDRFHRFFSPAKVNLMLAVHGRRPDGFHALTSLVAPLDFGDWLKIRVSAGKEGDRLSCDREDLPGGPENLVLRAAAVFRRASGEAPHFEFALEKRIPVGAGLGGGSSNAATALLGMNRICGEPFSQEALRGLAAEIGSDCPFFIEPALALMRGRGERLEEAAPGLREQLEGRRLLVFHPGFGVSTAWAYGALADSKAYSGEEEAERRLRAFLRGGAVKQLLFNSFESVVPVKYRAIEALLDRLRGIGVDCMMSGSGSACFAFPPARGAGLSAVADLVRDAWGERAFCIETSIAPKNT